MKGMKSALFSKVGCVAGFTANGEEVSGCYLPKSKTWKVWIGQATLLDPRAKTFVRASDADAYAETLIDRAVTERLRWW